MTSAPDVLHELADACGIATSYYGSSGELIDASADTLRHLLHALGEPVDDTADEAALAATLAALREREASRMLPRTVISTHGYPYVFPVHVRDGATVQVSIQLDSGEQLTAIQRDNWTPPTTVAGVTWGEASFEVPAEVPLGWHLIRAESEGHTAECALIVTPERLSSTHRLQENPGFGVMAQLYSARSRDSWGIGDFADLGLLAEQLAVKGADFLLINPIHAAEPIAPMEPSPYLPTTRRFINPIYLRIENIPECAGLDPELQAEVAELAATFQACNLSADPIERDPIYEAKLQVLRELYALPRTAERQDAFSAYCTREGQGLSDFATWCAQFELAQRPPSRHVNTDDELADLAGFYCWLQFLCDEQLAAAQQRAKAAGMRIGLVCDLAVGVHPGGADATTLAEVLAPEASVGAPPDAYNQRGQDWSQPPWHPLRLAEAGYRPWRDLLRTVLRHSGGIRIDHVLGLFRLFFIPRGQSPTSGTYVNFDFEALLGIVALEAELADAVVIGEDLGTYEGWVQEALSYRGVLGTSIVWFEGDASGDPLPQDGYRPLALTSVGTHDLPPTAGYLAGSHIALREQLGLLTTSAATEEATDLAWQNRVLDAAVAAGAFAGLPVPEGGFAGQARNQRGTTDDLVVGLHRFIAGSASALTCTQLVDMVGDRRAQNLPGTTGEQYPNWRMPLCDAAGHPVLIEDLAHHPLVARVATASRRTSA